IIEAKRTEQVKIPRYLDDIIVPAYELIRSELQKNAPQDSEKVIATGRPCCGKKGKKKAGETIDHMKVRNYDDFNEIFWRTSCLNLDIVSMFPTSDG
ncbi:unnamed protein product, partial [Sphacelaria rigidula]